MTQPADIVVPIPAEQVATHRKPRVYGGEIVNRKGEQYIEFAWESIPGRLVDDTFVEVAGKSQEEPALRRRVLFDTNNADHVAVLVLLDKIAKDSVGFVVDGVQE